MKTPRFFCDAALTPNTTYALPKSVAHHIRVRRLRAGEVVVLFDGSGHEFVAEIVFDAQGKCTARLGEAAFFERERRGRITLVQALASQDRMDWVIEKAVELGVATVITVPGIRSVVKLTTDRAEKKTKHWQAIVQAASEQCGRNHLMKVNVAESLQAALSMIDASPKLLFSVDATAGLEDLADVKKTKEAKPAQNPDLMTRIQQAKQVALFIGPEGGWERREIEEVLSRGGISVGLGPRILRTETAGLYATACLATQLGW